MRCDRYVIAQTEVGDALYVQCQQSTARRPFAGVRYQEQVMSMNKDQVKGRVKETKGKIKEAAGMLVGDPGSKRQGPENYRQSASKVW
jgi:hypothetical protein